MCQRHNRAIKVLGSASAFFRIWQVSQAKIFQWMAYGWYSCLPSLPRDRGVQVMLLSITVIHNDQKAFNELDNHIGLLHLWVMTSALN